MYTIYRATNTENGHSYIGFDCNWPYRKTAHKHAVKRGSKLVFHNAIRKYGWGAFEWTIIEQSNDREVMLNEREGYWIAKLNTHYLKGDGYNMTDGGESTFGWVPAQETRDKISKANKGRPAWNKGKPSPWTSKRNKALAGVPKPKLMKKYRITDPEGKIFIVDGLTKWAKENGLHAGNLCSVASGKLKHSQGYKCERITK